MPTTISNQRWAVGLLWLMILLELAGAWDQRTLGLRYLALVVLQGLIALGLGLRPQWFRALALLAPLPAAVESLVKTLALDAPLGRWTMVTILCGILFTAGLALLLWPRPSWWGRRLAIVACISALGPIPIGIQLLAGSVEKVAPSCTPRVGELEARLDDADATARLRRNAPFVELPEAPPNLEPQQPLQSGAVLIIARDQLTLEGIDVREDRMLAHQLDGLSAQIPPRAVQALIDPHQSSATVVRVLSRLTGSVVFFVVKGPRRGSMIQDAPMSVRDFAKQYSSAQKVEENVKLLLTQVAKLMAPCVAARMVAGYPERSVGQGFKGVREYVTESLLECSCADVDVDALEYVLLRGMGADLPLPNGVRMEVTPEWIRRLQASGDAPFTLSSWVPGD